MSDPIFRVVQTEEGFEPQHRYTRGVGEGEFWFPLTNNGYWLEPDAFSYGIITKHNYLLSRLRLSEQLLSLLRCAGNT